MIAAGDMREPHEIPVLTIWGWVYLDCEGGFQWKV